MRRIMVTASRRRPPEKSRCAESKRTGARDPRISRRQPESAFAPIREVIVKGCAASQRRRSFKMVKPFYLLTLASLAALATVSSAKPENNGPSARSGHPVTTFQPVAYARGDYAVFDKMVDVPRWNCGARDFRERARKRLCPKGTLINERVQAQHKMRGCNATLFLAICQTP